MLARITRIKIDKARLIGIIKANRERHKTAYLEAVKAWEAAQLQALRDATKAFEDEPEPIKHSIILHKPECYLDNYERALGMLELSVDDTIELLRIDGCGPRPSGLLPPHTVPAEDQNMVNHDLIRLRQALELIASTDPVDAALDPQRAVRVAREALSSAPHPAPADDSNADEQWHEGWFVEGRLLCRITDERKPANRDEICVTLANGSRSEEACGARARQLLDCIRGVAQQIGGGNG